jgi:hypothetical protein
MTKSRFDQKNDYFGQDNCVSVDYCNIADICLSQRVPWSFLVGNRNGVLDVMGAPGILNSFYSDFKVK